MRKYPEIKDKAGRIFLCMAVCLCFAMQSCMKDSLAECGVSIRIIYTLNPSHTDRLAEVGNFTVYIFDANGVFYDSRTVQGPFQDGRGYTVSFALHPGTYDFIVWGNLGEDYQMPTFVKGQTKESDASLLLSHLENNILRDSLPDLYYGALVKQVVKPALQQNQVYTVDMIKDTKDVTVIAKGLREGEDPLNTNLFSCYIASRNTD